MIKRALELLAICALLIGVLCAALLNTAIIAVLTAPLWAPIWFNLPVMR